MNRVDGINMGGIVFVDYVEFSERGMRIFVTSKRPSYTVNESVSIGRDNKRNISYIEVRTCSSPILSGCINVNYGSSTFNKLLANMTANPHESKRGFPMCGWKFTNVTREYKKYNYNTKTSYKEKVHVVTALGYRGKEINAILDRFEAKFPNYMNEFFESFDELVEQGKFTNVADKFESYNQRMENIQNRSNRSSSNNFIPNVDLDSEISTPKILSKTDISNAKLNQLRNYCDERKIKHKTSDDRSTLRNALRVYYSYM